MKKNGKKVFGDPQLLYRLVNLRRCGYSLRFLGKIFGCDHKAVHQQLQKYGIASPEEEYSLNNIIFSAVKTRNNVFAVKERRLMRTASGLENMGKRSYADYLAEADIPKGVPLKYVIV